MTTISYHVLAVLCENKQGLTMNQLADLVRARFACDPNSIQVVAANLSAKNLIYKERGQCHDCGSRRWVYKALSGSKSRLEAM